MIDQNFILDQQQLPLYKNEYIYKEPQMIWHSCDFDTYLLNEKEYLCANNLRALTHNDVKNIIKRLTYKPDGETRFEVFTDKAFPTLPKEAWATLNTEIPFIETPEGIDSIWSFTKDNEQNYEDLGFYAFYPPQETSLDDWAVMLHSCWQNGTWLKRLSSTTTPITSDELTDELKNKIKKRLYYLNYLNYCLQKNSVPYDPNRPTDFVSTIRFFDYRKRINTIKADWKIKLKGNFDINQLDKVSYLTFRLYKQNSNNLIWESQKINIDDINVNNPTSDFNINNQFIIYEFNNDYLELKENNFYKIIICFKYKDNTETQTNYGLLKCQDWDKAPWVNFPQEEIDENKIKIYSDEKIDYKITSYENPISSIKITKTFSNGKTENSSYVFIDLNKLDKKQTYNRLPFLKYGSVINAEQKVISYKGNTITPNPEEDSQNIFYYLPKLFSKNILLKEKNCWLLNGVVFDQKTYNGNLTTGLRITYADGSYENSKILIIPRKLFDADKKYTNFTFSIDQIGFLEKVDPISQSLSSGLKIAGLEPLDIEEKNNYNLNIAFGALNYFLRLQQAVNVDYLNKQHLTPLTLSLSSQDFDTYIGDIDNFLYTDNSGNLYIADIVPVSENNTKVILNSLNSLDEDGHFIDDNPIDLENCAGAEILQYCSTGIVIDNISYIINNNGIYSTDRNDILKPPSEQNQDNIQNGKRRLTLDFELTDSTDYIAIQIYSRNVSHFPNVKSSGEYYRQLNDLINSINIVPREEQIFDIDNFELPRTPFNYYEYNDCIPITSKLQKIQIDGLLTTNEPLQSKEVEIDYKEYESSGLSKDIFNYLIINDIERGNIPVIIRKDLWSHFEDYDFDLIRQDKDKYELLYSFNGASLFEMIRDIILRCGDATGWPLSYNNKPEATLRGGDSVGYYEDNILESPADVAIFLKKHNWIYKTFTYLDYSAEYGKTYTYFLQPKLKDEIHDSVQKYDLIQLDTITHEFDHMVLVDEEMSFVVKYNPKVSTYKTILAQTKTDTIGARFPFIRINGNNNYKQFALGGLISADFKPLDLFRPQTWSNENLDWLLKIDQMAIEKYYKNKVLDWFNNGKPKLLKTPAEGNFIVQLMNVNLTPVDQLGRRLHSFTCDAYEIAEYNLDNVKKYVYNLDKYVSMR